MARNFGKLQLVLGASVANPTHLASETQQSQVKQTVTALSCLMLQVSGSLPDGPRPEMSTMPIMYFLILTPSTFTLSHMHTYTHYRT